MSLPVDKQDQGLTREQYERLLRYVELIDSELDNLEKEGVQLRDELQHALDKQKMEQVLKRILNQSS